MEEKQSKQPLLFLFVALTASVCLAVTIAYLEITRDAEVEQLKSEVTLLVQYVEMLKLKINRTETFTKKIDDMLKKPSKAAAVGGSYDDDDDYYDDNYDYDYDDIKSPSNNNNNNNNSTNRDKRSVDDNGGRAHNILHMRTYPMFQHAPDNPQVMAKIFIAGEDDTQTPKPQYAFHHAKPVVRHGKNKHGKDAENMNGCCHTPVLAHFGGDTAAMNRERPIKNHRMCHMNGLITEWLPSPWVHDLGMESQIKLINRSKIRVEAPGIYYFYAQVLYADNKDSSGYVVHVNDHPKMHCVTTSLTHEETKDDVKHNSCFTGGLLKLHSGDEISLVEIEGLRMTIFEKSRSYIGLFRVAQLPRS